MLTRKDIAAWINSREPSSGAAVASLRAAVRLGVERRSIGYSSLASMALCLGDSTQIRPTTLKDSAIAINETKGRDYTQDSPDILKNFYTVAEICGLSPLAVWGVYVTKHVEAVASWLDGISASEPIESRLADLLVYSALGHFICKREASRS